MKAILAVCILFVFTSAFVCFYDSNAVEDNGENDGTATLSSTCNHNYVRSSTAVAENVVCTEGESRYFCRTCGEELTDLFGNDGLNGSAAFYHHFFESSITYIYGTTGVSVSGSGDYLSNGDYWCNNGYDAYKIYYVSYISPKYTYKCSICGDTISEDEYQEWLNEQGHTHDFVDSKLDVTLYINNSCCYDLMPVFTMTTYINKAHSMFGTQSIQEYNSSSWHSTYAANFYLFCNSDGEELFERSNSYVKNDEMSFTSQGYIYKHTCKTCGTIFTDEEYEDYINQ